MNVALTLGRTGWGRYSGNNWRFNPRCDIFGRVFVGQEKWPFSAPQTLSYKCPPPPPPQQQQQQQIHIHKPQLRSCAREHRRLCEAHQYFDPINISDSTIFGELKSLLPKVLWPSSSGQKIRPHLSMSTRQRSWRKKRFRRSSSLGIPSMTPLYIHKKKDETSRYLKHVQYIYILYYIIYSIYISIWFFKHVFFLQFHFHTFKCPGFTFGFLGFCWVNPCNDQVTSSNPLSNPHLLRTVTGKETLTSARTT